MARIDNLPVPPSRTRRSRAVRIPNAVLRRYEAFLTRVRSRRKAQKLSQAQVAAELGISSSQYCNFERGYSVLSVPKLIVLGDALGTSADTLLRQRRNGNR